MEAFYGENSSRVGIIQLTNILKVISIKKDSGYLL
jgi:hypothetical protein